MVWRKFSWQNSSDRPTCISLQRCKDTLLDCMSRHMNITPYLLPTKHLLKSIIKKILLSLSKIPILYKKLGTILNKLVWDKTSSSNFNIPLPSPTIPSQFYHRVVPSLFKIEKFEMAKTEQNILFCTVFARRLEVLLY